MEQRKTMTTVRLFYAELHQYLNERVQEFDTIADNRKTELTALVDYIRGRISKSEPAKLTFICTHNSRRSHFCQIWAQLAAQYYGLHDVETFSGGTRATAFNPRAIAALERSGCRITADDPNVTNPRYRVYSADFSEPQLCFSKIFDAKPNPSKGYCAVMTCSEADETCPLILGCDLRIPIRYTDPKAADDTEFEARRYDESLAQICREMLYLMSLV